MRIDQYMSPRAAAKWWRQNGRNAFGGGTYRKHFLPVHNTPQELYRLKKEVSQETILRKFKLNNGTITAFESGNLKKATDISWISLASFYGRHTLQVEVVKKTKWWGIYESNYNEIPDEPLHRRIRLAALATVKEHQKFLRRQKKMNSEKIPWKCVDWYRQGTICHEGIY